MGLTRFAFAAALVVLPLAAGDAVPAGPPGHDDRRGGDVHLPRPRWERRWIQALIREAAIAYGVDPGLVRAMVWVESRYDPYAVSPRGARGLMQLTSDTAREV
ncbi:MAG TPA: transglycosylase SLT domain-containing protein, partial [Vicinamibacteria bacterium]|nr:transglycosylase SLT domain-containing protein [Vicinamibacteria bacterium]